MRAQTPHPPPAGDTSACLVEALRRLLGHRTDSAVRMLETHISWVLLDGRHAWKIKKPVRLGFLDFARLATRKHFCDEELRLNRRLAPDLYEDVVAIRGTPESPRIDETRRDGDGAIIEYALRMRQFAPGALLSEKLAAATLEPRHLERFAARLAPFHETAPVAGSDTPYGSAQSAVGAVVDVLDGLAGQARPATSCAQLRAWVESRGRRLRERFDGRKARGFVRECHGDLHLANVVALGDDEVTAFDCIEFDPALRWIDVQNDIAFLVMDLLAGNRPDLAFAFLDAWLARTGDYEGLGVLRFYLVYRALVRALVASIRRTQGLDAAGPDYLRLAGALTHEPSACLMITHGLSGSGKSHLSRQLLARAGAIRLRSDVERKRLFGLQALDDSSSRVPGGIYGAEATARTYGRLLELAGRLLDDGWRVIVDAAFLRGEERRRFRELAARRNVPFTILHCRAEPDVLRRRVRERRTGRADASEADLAVLERQLSDAEPLDAEERRAELAIATDAAVNADALVNRWLADCGGAAW